MNTGCRIIGILGTAKNTGKTTTTGFLLEWANTENIEVGLTSIGFDGEDIDNITGLPKPRIWAKEGNLIATAEQCLSECEAEIEVIETTTIHTSLGHVFIGKVSREGLVVLAGPNKGKDLLKIIKRLKKQQSQLILVDGALNRIIPLIYCDALIVATGASRNTNIDLLVDETESIARVYSLPLKDSNGHFNQEIRIHQNSIIIFKKNGDSVPLNDYSLLSQQTLNNIVDNLDRKQWEEIYIPGIIQDIILNEMIEKYSDFLKGKTILINNPAYLLVGSTNIGHLKNLINHIVMKGINLKTIHHLPVLAITINPFYPKVHRYGKDSYEAAWVDKYQLYKKMKNRISFPVINVKEEESNKKLIMVIENFLSVN